MPKYNASIFETIEKKILRISIEVIGHGDSYLHMQEIWIL